jgi:ADP-ribose pyrophosphatase YjhB (NUDIX family)
MENDWLSDAKKLQAIALTGIEFTKDDYDKERYIEILNIAQQIISNIGNVPISRIEDLVSYHAKGYETPKVDVRGAVFRDDKILLVREKADGLWTLPGGYADVGLSAAENIEKEILEEAGIHTKADKIYSIRHKAKGAYDPDIRDFYKIFFICVALNDDDVKPGMETIDAKFFDLNQIPSLSTDRVIEEDLVMAWNAKQSGEHEVVFD